MRETSLADTPHPALRAILPACGCGGRPYLSLAKLPACFPNHALVTVHELPPTGPLFYTCSCDEESPGLEMQVLGKLIKGAAGGVGAANSLLGKSLEGQVIEIVGEENFCENSL